MLPNDIGKILVFIKDILLNNIKEEDLIHQQNCIYEIFVRILDIIFNKIQQSSSDSIKENIIQYKEYLNSVQDRDIYKEVMIL